MFNGSGTYIGTSLSRFDPFGNFRTPPTGSNPTITNHGYTGHRHNNLGSPDLGLIYMNARYYLPEVGRFISPDTIVPEPGNPQSYNRYAYAHNNPINNTDPTGHCVFAFPFDTTICVAIGALAVAAYTIAAPDAGLTADAAQAASEELTKLGDHIRYVAEQVEGAAEAGSELIKELGGGSASPNPRKPDPGGKHKDPAGATETEDNVAGDYPRIKEGSQGGPTAGKKFPESVRQEALSGDPSRTCVFCGRPGVGSQVDHVIPRSAGGNATIENAQLACPHCNASKGSRSLPVTPPEGYKGAWPPPWWPK